jgi:membrane protein implicated in regulation of membrane protease activity
VFAAGVFEVPLFSYTSAITIARLFRYFGIGYLAIRYGADAMPYLMSHKLQVTVFVILLVIVSYVLSRVLLRRRAPPGDVN